MKQLYTFSGVVIKGKQRGNDLGFPTANIALIEKIPEGIYCAEVEIEDKKFQSATFIGSAKTFGEEEVKAEVHILDFKGNLYGKFISVTLFKKLRENKKFSSEKNLIDQMKNDVQLTRYFFTHEIKK